MPIAVNHQTGETIYLGDDGQWQKAQTAVNPQTKEMLAFDGKAWQPVPAQSKGVLGHVDDAVRSIANGLTFGYADELSAKMDELTGRGGTYEQNVAKERARDQQIPAAISIPGEIAGAVGSTVLAAPAAAASGALRAAQALPAFARFGSLGAAEGALAGSGNATEGQRLQGAGTGAAIGGFVGASAPKIIDTLAKGGRAIRNALSPEANVSADLTRAIARDADDPASLMARVNDQSIDRPGIATLADAGGENVRGLVERVAQTPGAGRTQVVPALTGRQQGQAIRLSHDLRSLTGTTRTAHQAITEVTAERAAAARPLYQQAYDEGDRVLWSPALERLTGAPSFQRAMRRAVQSWKDQAIADGYGAMSPGTLVENGIIRFQGSAGVPAFPNLQFWDYTKRILDDQVRTAINSGQGQKAQALTRITQSLRDELDNLGPETYRAARDAWAGPSRYLDAIEEGRNILRTNISSEELAASLPRMTTAEREGFRIGAIAAIIGRMGNDSAKLGDMTKYLRSPEVRAKIAAIMPNEEAAREWARRLDFEVSSSELTGRALGNSATARRLAERQDADNLAGDLVMDALTGTPQSFVKKVIGAGPKWLRDTLRSRADAMLADVLTNPARVNDLPDVLRQTGNISIKPISDRTNAAVTAGGTEFLVDR